MRRMKNTGVGKHNEDERRHASLSLSSSRPRREHVEPLQSRFVIVMTEIYSRSDRDDDFRDRTTRQVGDGVAAEQDKVKHPWRAEAATPPSPESNSAL